MALKYFTKQVFNFFQTITNKIPFYVFSTLFFSLFFFSPHKNIFAETLISKDDLAFFKTTADEARKDLQDQIQNQKFAQIETIDIPLAGQTDIIYFPSQSELKTKQFTNMLVFISGTHGVEAHTGSALQRFLIDRHLKKSLLNKTSVLFIHGLNAYGFKNNRRVNENNIDLNRNFIIDRDQFAKDNPKHDLQYKKIDAFLNPTSFATNGISHKFSFYTSALLSLIQFGLEPLRQSILQGQYFQKRGLFYGGSSNEKQIEIVNHAINKFIVSKLYHSPTQNPPPQIMIIDLHTGYGARGKLHLLAGTRKSAETLHLFDYFSPEEIDFGDSKKFYTTSGDVLTYFVDQLKKITSTFPVQAKISAITFEFGTMDSQKILGSLESLRLMRQENQNYHFPSEDPTTQLQIKNDFLEMFYPSDSMWRTSVLDQGLTQTNKVLSKLEL